MQTASVSERTMPRSSRCVVYEKIIFEQNVKGICIFSNQIRCSATRSQFRVLAEPHNKTLRVYGRVADESVSLPYNKKVVEKFISGSRVRFSRDTKGISENNIQQTKFSSLTCIYLLPVGWSIDVKEIIMRDMCSLREIASAARKAITYPETESALSMRDPLRITLHDNAKISAKIDRCSINVVLYDESKMQCAEKIEFPDNQTTRSVRRIASTIHNLTAVLHSKSHLCGVSVTGGAQISVLSVAARCSINALGNCQVVKTGPNCEVRRYGPTQTTDSSPSPPNVQVIATFRGIPREEALEFHRRVQDRTRRPVWATNASGDVRESFEELLMRTVLQRSMEETSNTPTVDHRESFFMDDEQKSKFKKKHFELSGNAEAASSSSTVNIGKDGAKLKPHSCMICMENTPSVVIDPCGHFVFCGECADTSQFHIDKCPLCKKNIERAIRTRLTDLVEL